MIRVAADQVTSTWGIVAPILKKAVDKGVTGHSLDMILVALITEQCQLWVTKDFKGCFVTNVNGNICNILYMAGNEIDEWLDDAIEEIAAWATREQCEYLQATGRKGLIKKAKPLGFTHTTTTIVRKLCHQQR